MLQNSFLLNETGEWRLDLTGFIDEFVLFIYIFSMNGLGSVKEVWLLTVKCVRCSVLTRARHCGIVSLFREMQHYYIISPTWGPKGVKTGKNPITKHT